MVFTHSVSFATGAFRCCLCTYLHFQETFYYYLTLNETKQVCEKLRLLGVPKATEKNPQIQGNCGAPNENKVVNGRVRIHLCVQYGSLAVGVWKITQWISKHFLPRNSISSWPATSSSMKTTQPLTKHIFNILHQSPVTFILMVWKKCQARNFKGLYITLQSRHIALPSLEQFPQAWGSPPAIHLSTLFFMISTHNPLNPSVFCSNIPQAIANTTRKSESMASAEYPAKCMTRQAGERF